MSTRSMIGKLEKDGIRAIYCHGEGSIEHNGVCLFRHYQSTEKVDALLELGDLSLMGQNIGERHDFYNYTGDVCNAYCRDRDEEKKDTEARFSPSFEEFVKRAEACGVAYIYLYAVDKWLVSAGGSEFVSLERELNLREL